MKEEECACMHTEIHAGKNMSVLSIRDASILGYESAGEEDVQVVMRLGGL